MRSAVELDRKFERGRARVERVGLLPQLANGNPHSLFFQIKVKPVGRRFVGDRHG